MLLSNHSYGDLAGWYFNDLDNHWEWYGLPGDTVDYNFGFYGERTQEFDSVSYNAPQYLIVESAGNARAVNGPPVGTDYYGYATDTSTALVDRGPRPANISSNGGYDVISTTGNAKNILTVGAVNPLPNGPANSGNISTTYFSSWGPTDDGRVKPDIVGDGVDVLSTGSSSSTSYITLSGTSMSAPNVTGSLYLLQEYYAEKNQNKFMRAATLKGLACHTAFDAGSAGPDYIYGWGLLDMLKAVNAITNNGGKSIIEEQTLVQGQQQTFNVTASGDGLLSATIAWTDPPGTLTPEGTVNSRTPKLVNDLDIRITDGTTTFTPWILDPANPSAAAKTGDNIVDNVEQVFVPQSIPGKSYTITVSNKGTLLGGSQDFSLIATGIGGSAYCASAPLSNADSKINNFALANINYTAPADCTTYTDNTSLTINMEQGKTYPLSLTTGTCGANSNKAAKIYIDWNGNGTFEADELVAATGIINATGTYSTNITVPISVIPGNFSRLRIVLAETSDTSFIPPCGSYAKGETQDYRIEFFQASADAGVTAIISPDSTGSCPDATQLIVNIKNFGSKAISNIPVTATITGPGNTVTTLNQTYTGTLQPLEQENFIFNNTFSAIAGASYQITAATQLPGDVIGSDNQATATAIISSPPAASGLTAYYCNNSNSYQLAGTGNGTLLWYQNPADSIPVASGSPAATILPPVDSIYYAGLNDFKGTVGPAAKSAFTGGGYNQFTPAINVTTSIPIVIEKARLYIGNSGTITFNAADASGRLVSSATVAAIATATNPRPGAQPDDPNDQGAVYNLNLVLPAAGTYTISTVYDSIATIYRSNSGVTGYPFALGNVFSITGNTAVSATDTAYYKGFYYYLYDIKLKSYGCPAANRVAVPLSILKITQTGNTLSSNFAAGNQWYLDGKAIAGAVNNTYIPSQSGNYTVSVTEPDSCRLLSANYTYALLANNPGSNTDIGLVVFPVPASTQMNIIFAAKTNTDLNLSLINAAGKIVYKQQQAVTQGNSSTVINVNSYAPGTYVLKLSLGQKSYNTKVSILR